MSFAKKHNVKPSPFTFKTPEGHPYVKPIELANQNGIGTVYTIRAMYVNKGGKFGDEPVIVTDDFILNAPHHLVDTVREIIDDDESTQLINSGKAAFKFYSYANDKGSQLGVTWCDVDSQT